MKKLLLSILLVIMMVSCGEKPETAVSKFLDSVKTKKLEEAGKYVTGDNIQEEFKTEYNNPIQQLFFETLFKNVKYKVLKTEKKDDKTSLVTVEIENVDTQKVFITVFKKLIKDNFSDNGATSIPIEEEFKKVLESKDIPLMKNTTQFVVTKTDKGNKVHLTKENIDIIFGKINTTLANLNTLDKQAEVKPEQKPAEKPQPEVANPKEEKKEAPKVENKQKVEQPK